MKRSFKILALAACVFVATSCDDEDPGIDPIVDPVEIPTEFSDLTSEQNKQNLQDNGLELVGNLNELKSAAGIETSISFSHFLSESELPDVGSGRKATASTPLSLIRELANFGSGKTSASRFFRALRTTEEDPTLQEMYDELVGVFAYNAADDTWSHTPGTDGKIVFKFPSTETGTTNDAEFVIYDFTSVVIDNTEAEYTGEVPTGVKADLTVSGTKQIEYSYTAAYKDNGEPTSVETTLKIGAFSFNAEVVNNTEEVSVAYSLKKNDSNIIAMGVSAKGEFTSSNIDNSESPGDVLSEGSAYFQVLDIKLAGNVDVTSLDAALDGELTPDQEAAAWNEHAEFVVFYVSSNKKIAETEFYGVSETDSGKDCYDYDINGDQVVDENDCYEWSYTDEYIDVRLIFADGSKSDLATYTDVGFEELTDELEAFIDDLESDLD